MDQNKTELEALEDDKKLNDYIKQLDEFRCEGVNKVLELKQEIIAVKKSKMIEQAEKAKLISKYKNQIVTARAIAIKNKNADAMLTKEAIAYSNRISKEYLKKVTSIENAKIKTAKEDYVVEIDKIKKASAVKKEIFKKKYSGEELKFELKANKVELNATLFDAKNKFTSFIGDCKDTKHNEYINHIQTNISLRNNKTKFSENFKLSLKNYTYNFTASKFFLENGLYLAILIFFIVCIIIAPMHGNGQLLTLPNIFTILEQSSTRMFYALGVAGLILLAGTDLSVGRMVALGSVTTGLILHPSLNIVTLFGLAPWDFTTMPMTARVIFALFLSITLCVTFSAFAGFFSAKLKIHPFISTLATQLIIYGLLFFGTSGTPVGSIDSGIKDVFGGRWVLGFVNGELVTFPKLIVPAIIAVFVAWFIWNKTIFGKNIFAVGGNPEAASVSGINVFKVTLGVFIMAGVFYGFGAFFEAFRANASAGTGQGYELDAIAACVVGGISFFGGIGKIQGAVAGVLIFTGLTYCLTFLGIDSNLQFVFKGLIIIAAVSLDSFKYLKRK
jgi:methyl-galactoside transport system permease protein